MKSVVITGATKRGGAAIARHIHRRDNTRIILQCRAKSIEDADALAKELTMLRADSAVVWPTSLDANIAPPPHVESIVGIVASASRYNPSSIENVHEKLSEDLQIHIDGHLALINACKRYLAANSGAIVAITDVHVERPHAGYLSYQIAKGALSSAVTALAVELAPAIRVNAVAPGALDWPTEYALSDERKMRIIQTTPLARIGTFAELAHAVDFLLFDATFTTGSTLRVDGGRSIFLE